MAAASFETGWVSPKILAQTRKKGKKKRTRPKSGEIRLSLVQDESPSFPRSDVPSCAFRPASAGGPARRCAGPDAPFLLPPGQNSRETCPGRRRSRRAGEHGKSTSLGAFPWPGDTKCSPSVPCGASRVGAGEGDPLPDRSRGDKSGPARNQVGTSLAWGGPFARK